MKKLLFIVLFADALAMAIIVSTCSASGKFTDERDGRVYKTVKIGDQMWMAENLNYETESSRCYDNNPANCETYGRLYTWREAVDVCPMGWFLPRNEDWNILYDFVDKDTRGARASKEVLLGKYLKAKAGWKKEDNGEDTYGFAALPGGSSDSIKGFKYIGEIGSWWSATDDNDTNAHINVMYYYSDEHSNLHKKKDFDRVSIRCVDRIYFEPEPFYCDSLPKLSLPPIYRKGISSKFKCEKYVPPPVEPKKKNVGCWKHYSATGRAPRNKPRCPKD